MTHSKAKVFVALSGGVDSSTAAAVLLEAGYDCSAVFMITNNQAQAAQADAEKIAAKLGIKLYVMDLRSDFEQVLDYFCGEYAQGRTPNPCVFCNRHMKFGKVLDFARANGAEHFATGHYAQVLDTGAGFGLYAATNSSKDQSYALAMIRKEVLDRLILPMGRYTKDQTRKMAAKFGLGTEKKAESQEICFIPNDDYIAVLEDRHPELVREGNIVDGSGENLGTHRGSHRFTIGQRRGLRIAMGKPYYVTKINAETNTVTLGPKKEVMHNKLTANRMNWLVAQEAPAFRASVMIRYNSAGVPATVSCGQDTASVEFDQSVSAITPGQLAAFYVNDELGRRLVGGGWIERAFD